MVGQPTEQAYDTWGVLDPGKGYLLGRSDAGEVSLWECRS